MLSLRPVKYIIYTLFLFGMLACKKRVEEVKHDPGVHVIDSFYMPQFGYARNVWVYLPPDYATGEKKYPVLYMQDGQNLFEDSVSFVGEWRVDETLDSMHTAGDYGCIVVAVENGGDRRIAEYMPNPHPKYGGGRGEHYVDFLINTLKPHIDSTYRTLPVGYNAIGGSSLGGLISFYAATHHDSVFGRAMILSPSFWIDSTYTNWLTKGRPRIYFAAGEFEDDGDVMAKINDMKSIMFALGYKANFVYPADGEHSEWFWAREFGPAYQWLFEDLNNDIK